jgi:hypothetical protein
MCRNVRPSYKKAHDKKNFWNIKDEETGFIYNMQHHGFHSKVVILACNALGTNLYPLKHSLGLNIKLRPNNPIG